MISADRKILEEGSTVRKRMAFYAEACEELHIIVFTRRNFQFSIFNFQKVPKIQISKNCWAYPTNSLSRWFYIFDAIHIGKSTVKGQLSKANYFVVSCQDPFLTGLVGWRLAKKLAIPLEFQVHTDFLSPYFRAESFFNRLRVLIARFLLPRADGVRVVSKRIRDSLIHDSRFTIHDSKITVLPVFVGTGKIKKFPVSVDLRKKYNQFSCIALVISRLSREKNIMQAFRAFQESIKKIPDAGLVVVGDGPERERLERFVAVSGLGDRVIFEGWSEDVFSYYKTADLFLLTSRYEGYGRSLVEAAAAGCAIISTDVGVASEILPEADTLPVGDGAVFSSRLSVLLGDQRERRANREYSASHLSAVTFPSKEKFLESFRYSLASLRVKS